MIGYTVEAWRQVSDLRAQYKREQRPEAVRNLRAALHEVESRIESNPEAGLPAPRPYPFLARLSQAWVKVGAYWVRYSTEPTPVITGVCYDRTNIPGRV